MEANLWGVTIGKAIEAARKKAGLSAVQLSASCAEYGTPVHRVAISKIETGDRDVTLPELVAIAAALETPPLALLFPDVLVPIQLFPGLEVVGTEALGWFSGLGTDSPFYASIDHGPPELLWVYQPQIPVESWSIRLVQIEEAIKAQLHHLHRMESTAVESPLLSDKQRAIRAAEVDHARRVLQLLKDDWTDVVYDQLARKYGVGRVPAGAYDPDRIDSIEERLTDIDSPDLTDPDA
ncbi:helix-turn-helix transcriptional regulator [Mycobacteroides abscessus subsp. abscessus]|uniref:helix-turn-helix domain-containing protein n=1 Tax=Mycobacteroides abscessus TaxID=36809 RepID=UPI00092A7500|nr:helix-turn-helix transcriptional regulator [Mycobacteroides abscessus]MBN7402838.1 helix-turn-helix transcriptional regulator [Mycobacteroides abscessus subsp. abscessus]MDO3088875.1 helix-turn-helix transcriptional regulator [Mycobacteroides abscessus subsp. abscessus]MDO3270660.1 helix-turn-helix transcriptional regulator [Mycobacteroides abscessus subsp. abscessus]SHQ37878.1 Putative regulator or DNA-binding protein [Mycobacteroides abscessus subsp. abscessus]SHY83185.1 Putative regulato